MAEAKAEPKAVCVCGDWETQHTECGCGVCRNSRAPWDGCKKYVYSHMEVPRRLLDASPAEEEQG